MARLADRFALLFLGVTVALASATWVLTSDPTRAVAVLAVATPLILAVPVALVAGMSRAAGRGILVKGGKALETLARIRVLVLDKTGTLTSGRARLVEIRATSAVSASELLRLAASLDQASKHVVAEALVAEAEARGVRLSIPSAVVETPGEGVEGIVDGDVWSSAVGRSSAPASAPRLAPRSRASQARWPWPWPSTGSRSAS